MHKEVTDMKTILPDKSTAISGIAATQNGELQQTVNQLLNSVTTLIGENKAFKERIERVEKRNERLGQQNERLVKQNEALVEENKSFKEKIELMGEQASTQTQRIQLLQEQNKILASDLEKQKISSEDQISVLKTKIDQVERKNKSLEEKMKGFEGKFFGLKMRMARMDKFNDRLGESESKLQKLRNELEDKIDILEKARIEDINTLYECERQNYQLKNIAIRIGLRLLRSLKVSDYLFTAEDIKDFVTIVEIDRKLFVTELLNIIKNTSECDIPSIAGTNALAILKASGVSSLASENFEGVKLLRPDFSNMILIKTNFKGATLVKPNFTNADLNSANFNGGTLEEIIWQDETKNNKLISQDPVINIFFNREGNLEIVRQKNQEKAEVLDQKSGKKLSSRIFARGKEVINVRIYAKSSVEKFILLKSNINGNGVISCSKNGEVIAIIMPNNVNEVGVLKIQQVNGNKSFLAKHGVEVTYAIFNDDGKILVSGCVDGSVRLWNIADIAAGEGKLIWNTSPHFCATEANMRGVKGLTEEDTVFLSEQGVLLDNIKENVKPKENVQSKDLSPDFNFASECSFFKVEKGKKADVKKPENTGNNSHLNPLESENGEKEDEKTNKNGNFASFDSE